MTTRLTWHDNWELGIDWLDADHKEIARLLNRLIDAEDQEPAGETDKDSEPGARAQDGGADGLLVRLDAVVAHLREHFGREEQFLREIDYPHYEEHRGDHAMQLAEFADLRRELESNHARRLDGEAAEGIKRWFFNHVIAEDQRFVQHYRERSDSRPASLTSRAVNRR